MKIQSLEENYLRGLIDMAISNYNEHCKSVPADLGYTIERVFKASLETDKAPLNAVKITFNWTIEGERAATGDEEFPYENLGKKADDYFTILAGEKIIKLQSYIEDVLDCITGS